MYNSYRFTYDSMPIKKLIFRAIVICLVVMFSIKALHFPQQFFPFHQVLFKGVLKTYFIIHVFVIAISTMMYTFGFAKDKIRI